MSRYGSLLIVDDALFMRAVIRSAVESMFDTFFEAADPSSAIEVASIMHPGMITVDLSLDKEEALQGVGLIKDLKECSPDSKMIVISAIDQEHIKQRVLENGALAIIRKPFTEEQIQQTITMIMEG